MRPEGRGADLGALLEKGKGLGAKGRGTYEAVFYCAYATKRVLDRKERRLRRYRPEEIEAMYQRRMVLSEIWRERKAEARRRRSWPKYVAGEAADLPAEWLVY